MFTLALILGIIGGLALGCYIEKLLSKFERKQDVFTENEEN